MADLDRHPTLRQFIDTLFQGNDQDSDLGSVITAIADGACQVHQQIQSAPIVGAIGTTNETNVQGEIVHLLDTASSDIFVEVLSQSNHVAAIGCEELEEPVICGHGPEHKYMVLMDPLDGSSNIDVAVSIGSIFGIWRRSTNNPLTESSLLRPGNEQVAAAYVVYGSSTILVIATHGSVQGFTLDPNSGTFVLTHHDIRTPTECAYYSTNEGNFTSLDANTQVAITELRNTLSLRYVGSLVADFHRNLLKGGIFLYPADHTRPEGRLRLMYEANPLGFVAEQAGGTASTGKEQILDVKPARLHQRTPLIIGNKDLVEHTITVIRHGNPGL